MNFSYSNNLNHPYANSNYQQRNKVPQSVLNVSTMPLKQTLIRNQSFQNRKYNDEIIQLIAKIRSLEDDLINQRFKNQTLQRKLIQYEKIIENLQYQLTSQNYQLHKYQHQIELSNQKNIEILKYQQNLKLVGQEIQEINNVLMIKNKEYDAILDRNKNLEFQIKKIQQENHLLKVNQSIWKKQLDLALQQSSIILLQLKQANNKSSSHPKNINSFSSQSNFKQYLSPQKQNNKILNQSNGQNSVSFNYNNSNQQMSKRIEVMKQLFMDLSNQYKALSKQHENIKKESSIALIRQRQKNIKNEYEYKLQQQRIKDLTKKQPDALVTLQKQKKIQQIIQELLKKEDEYVVRIDQNQHQIEQLKRYISELQQGNEYVQSVQLKQKKSIIQTLLRQKNILQQQNSQLSDRVNILENKYHQLSIVTERQSTMEEKNNIMLQKKIRKVEEENIQLKIKVQELCGEVNLLNKEIHILKRSDEGLENEDHNNDSQLDTHRKSR